MLKYTNRSILCGSYFGEGT